jgi:hypothetical protein
MNDDLSNIDIEELLRSVEEAVAAKKLRDENPYVRDLIRVLWPYQRGLQRQFVIDRVWALRQPKGLPIPKTFEQTVQSSFNQYNAESQVFLKSGRSPEEALFYPVGGKGSGRWAVYHERAARWLRGKALDAI